MKNILVVFLFINCWASIWANDSAQSLQYRDQHRSLILWDQVNVNEWSDLDLWKKQLYLKETTPQWELTLRENRLKEATGIVLQCIGQCRVETGEGNSTARFRTRVFEEEDIVTAEQSYLWIYMMDGSLVRLSPDSSITLKEINIGQQEIFFHIRVNFGNVLWLSRSSLLHKANEGRETDSLFLPLDFYEANELTKIIDVDESSLMALLEDSTKSHSRISQLNQLIEENNQFANTKPTWLLMVAPNGSCFAKNPTIEMVVLTGGDSYLKARNNDQLGLDGPSDDYSLEFDFRGFRGETSTTLASNQWYQLSSSGRDIVTPPSTMLQQLNIGEFPTRRIPSILIARELLLKEYSKFVFDLGSDRLTLARDYGYRLWGKMPEGELTEIFARAAFLREYMRRLETTNLLASDKVLNEYKALRETVKGSVYSSIFSQGRFIIILKKEMRNLLPLLILES